MDGYSISQVAERTGFPASTLRFYEQSGLVRPARTPAGYRSYGDDHIELLEFIGRAKGFGLSLDEITELLGLLDQDRCAPVQGRLRDLVDAKIADAEDRITELSSFTAELRRVADSLGQHTPDGPCDDVCGCTSEPPGPWTSIDDAAQHADDADVPIVCTLEPGRIGDRLARWHALVSSSERRERIHGGARLRFGRDVDLTTISELIASEQDCCRFLAFTLTIGASGITLDVSAPPSGQPIIDDLLGPRP